MLYRRWERSCLINVPCGHIIFLACRVGGLLPWLYYLARWLHFLRPRETSTALAVIFERFSRVSPPPRAASEGESAKIATTVQLVTFYTFFFSLGSQVSLVSTSQVGYLCFVTLNSLSLFHSLSLPFSFSCSFSSFFLFFLSCKNLLSSTSIHLLWRFVNLLSRQFSEAEDERFLSVSLLSY